MVHIKIIYFTLTFDIRLIMIELISLFDKNYKKYTFTEKGTTENKVAHLNIHQPTFMRCHTAS